MNVDIRRSGLTPGERIKLYRMLRKQRKKGKVAGINRIPNNAQIKKYLNRVSKPREA